MSELPVSLGKLGKILDDSLTGNLKEPLEVHKLSEVDDPDWTITHVHLDRRIKKSRSLIDRVRAVQSRVETRPKGSLRTLMRSLATGHETRVATRMDEAPKPFEARKWAARHLSEFARADELVENVYTFDVAYQGAEVDVLPEMVFDKGPDLLIKEVHVDGVKLHPSDYVMTKTKLKLFGLKKNSKVTFVTLLSPKDNHGLQGTYESGGAVATQYETLGFKNDTPCLTRPDVMPTWSADITVDPKEYEVVEATGNRTETSSNPDGTKTHSFENPIPSAAYVQANAVGNLEWIEDEFVTMSGRRVQLKVFGSKGKASQCRVVLNVLKDFLRWEEEVFGLEYPLDEYKVIVIDDFNFGAMENLGMNVFNAARGYIDFDVATDGDILDRYSIVSHEAAHTHSGNVTTLKSWHQIPLKEGLTRLRDQMYEESVIGPELSRVKQVRTLKAIQFPIDASDRAKPVLQKEYEGDPMNGMYLPTAYEKGAELLRMMRVFLGDEVFIDALKHFFEKHRGEAVTVENLIVAIEESSGEEFKQLRCWYDQVGTPTCSIAKEYDPATGRTTLRVKQENPRAPHDPLMMPMEYAFVTADGQNIKGKLIEGGSERDDLERGILALNAHEHVFVFEDIPEDAVPSLFRGLSAPVHVDYPYSPDELKRLAKFDSDAVNRIASCETMATTAIQSLMDQIDRGEDPVVEPHVLQAYEAIVENIDLSDPQSIALASSQIQVPSMELLLGKLPKPYRHRLTFKARKVLMSAIGAKCKDSLIKIHTELNDGPDRIDAEKNAVRAGQLDVAAINRRRLRSVCIQLLSHGDSMSHAEAEFGNACHMTNELNALAVLSGSEEHAQQALSEFSDRWGDRYQAKLKWIRLATTVPGADADYFRGLLKHKNFNVNNPNMCYEFARGLYRNYDFAYAEDGSGVEFYADFILSLKNENVACSILRWMFGSTSKVVEPVRSHMYKQLERLKEKTTSEEVRSKCEGILKARENS